MQFLENWDPLNLPRGSIRALVTLALFGVLWTQMLLGREVPSLYVGLVMLVLGHYFGSRSKKSVGGNAKSPLGLPRGTVRAVIILGFGAVAYFLWSQGKLELNSENRNVMILFLAGAFQAGFLLRVLADIVSRGKPTPPRRWFENLKAIVVLVTTGLLAMASFLAPDDPANQNIMLVLAPIVGLYFGSRY